MTSLPQIPTHYIARRVLFGVLSLLAACLREYAKQNPLVIQTTLSGKATDHGKLETHLC